MPCTTILVGKKASYDGSTIIARNDDNPSGMFAVKNLKIVNPNEQPKIYKSKIGKLTIELPDNPVKYTCFPTFDKKDGIWGATGINDFNVGMSATETITTNSRVLGADPYQLKDGKPNGIGEEDFVTIILPYIKTAKEGVLRLGELLEKYGTYESNGIAFNDENDIWWVETIGGHHFIAKRIEDDKYVSMPNQFGMDEFDLEDALTTQKNYICSADLKEFIAKNHLDLNNNEYEFNPRLIFGSHDDSDHVYNTPRSWAIERYFNPRSYVWEGENKEFSPESDDIPFSLKPERKITVDDVKWALSNHYQGTEYDPYSKNVTPKTNMYRSIGVNRTSVIGLLQIRGYKENRLKSILWFSFASNVFNTLVPFYTNGLIVPKYYSNANSTPNTNNFYWANRFLSVLADSHFNKTAIYIERYQDTVMSNSYNILNTYDKIFEETKDIRKLNEANLKVAKMVEKETNSTLDKVLYVTSMLMKNAFARSDN